MPTLLNAPDTGTKTVPAYGSKPLYEWTGLDTAQSVCDQMWVLLSERIERESKKEQPDTTQIAQWQAEQAQCNRERDALREDDKPGQRRILDAYLPAIQDDRDSEEKVTDWRRIEIMEEAKDVCQDWWTILMFQELREEHQKQPDQSLIERLTAEMEQCADDEHNLFRTSLAEHKRIIAKYTPLIRAHYKAREEKFASEPAEIAMKWVVCLDNTGCEVDLELQKLYQVIEDEASEKAGCVRIIDGSGEEYVYAANRFSAIKVAAPCQRF
jgi:hypothetical protein